MARKSIRWPKRDDWVVVEWKDACFYNVTGENDVRSLKAPRMKRLPARTAGMVTDINHETIALAHTVFEHGDKSRTSHEVMVIPRSAVTAIAGSRRKL